MPGPLLTAGSIIQCAHGAPAQATAPNPRVVLSGQPVVTMAAPHVVTGCPFNISGAPSPCVTANWVVGAVRVLAGGTPVLLMDSQAICIPNGTPVLVTMTQPRVIGS
ncbi:MAG: hypothetical protein ABSB41_16090 [Anaerolineales bacterium]|jgi:hypothetical protein